MKERKKKEKEKAATGEEKFERAQYNCAFQDEDEGGRDFAPPELVWGKVRSHPWWPGQVFDAADASEIALQHRRAGAPLVAYFWDRTFAWSDPSAPTLGDYPPRALCPASSPPSTPRCRRLGDA